MTDNWNCCKCNLTTSRCRQCSAVCRVGVKEARLVLAALLELAFVFTLLVVRRRVESRFCHWAGIPVSFAFTWFQ